MTNQYHNLGWLLITLSNYNLSFYNVSGIYVMVTKVITC